MSFLGSVHLIVTSAIHRNSQSSPRASHVSPAVEHSPSLTVPLGELGTQRSDQIPILRLDSLFQLPLD